ncbi:hypothetical protein AVEN_93827-1 [Araneus ventricosus]|uniref:Uncharacterized protein n=1 Tax=Araneus ventricosus TaxID=182803 RepID=A0A4Y2AXK3_ARAVE|nr:hypothetical protein AVEN_93827-1 [Araneus ventricosus]
MFTICFLLSAEAKKVSDAGVVPFAEAQKVSDAGVVLFAEAQKGKTLRWKFDGMRLFLSKGIDGIVMINGKMPVSMYVDIMSQNLKKSISKLSVVDGISFKEIMT